MNSLDEADCRLVVFGYEKAFGAGFAAGWQPVLGINGVVIGLVVCEGFGDKGEGWGHVGVGAGLDGEGRHFDLWEREISDRVSERRMAVS